MRACSREPTNEKDGILPKAGWVGGKIDLIVNPLPRDHRGEAEIIQSGSHIMKAALAAAFSLQLDWTVEPFLSNT
jgi:hypothetical protein